MNLFKRLAIGTANWAKPYNGKQLEEKEIRDILDYCTCCGIDMLDTAAEYGSEEIIGRLANSSFDIVTKGNGDIERSLKSLDRDRVYGYLFRDPDFLSQQFGRTKWKYGKIGTSLYDDNYNFVGQGGLIQLPYSLMDRRNESRIELLHQSNIEIHVRSIFLRGICLEKATPQECLQFVLTNPCVDRVVIGVDSLDQLKEDIDFIHKWNSMVCNDENIIDPRRWKGEE